MAKTILGTTTYPCGIIPFGSDDEAVVFQDSMISASGAAPANGTAMQTPVFDADGLLCTNGSWMFDLSGLAATPSLSIAGQFSFEVEAIAIAETRANTGGAGTTGRTVVPNCSVCSWAATSGTSGSPYGDFIIGANGIGYYELVSSSAASTPDNSLRITDYGGERFKRVTISWNGSEESIYLDGALYKTTAIGNVARVSGLFNYFYLGSTRGRNISTAFTLGPYHIKNFIISNRPVMTPVHPMLATVCLAGDSFFQGAGSTVNSPAAGYDHNLYFQLPAYLRERGIGIKTVNVAVTGSAISTGAAAKLLAQIQPILDTRPTIVCIHSGLNDATQSAYSASLYESTYKGHLTTLLAAGTGIQKVFVGTPTTCRGHVATYANAWVVPNTASIRAIVMSLPAWWDENNPTDTGRVVVYDLFTEIGGEDAADDMLMGKWWSSYTSYNADVHLSSKGRRVFGRLVGRTIYDNLP